MSGGLGARHRWCPDGLPAPTWAHLRSVFRRDCPNRRLPGDAYAAGRLLGRHAMQRPRVWMDYRTVDECVDALVYWIDMDPAAADVVPCDGELPAGFWRGVEDEFVYEKRVRAPYARAVRLKGVFADGSA